jgi:hypothetical protein
MYVTTLWYVRKENCSICHFDRFSCQDKGKVKGFAPYLFLYSISRRRPDLISVLCISEHLKFGFFLWKYSCILFSILNILFRECLCCVFSFPFWQISGLLWGRMVWWFTLHLCLPFMLAGLGSVPTYTKRESENTSTRLGVESPMF